MPDPLRGLVVRIRHGDRAALDEFARQYADLIRALARRRIRQLQIERDLEPDEVLNATLLEMCRSVDRIQAAEPGELLSYVARIVRTQTRLVWRRSQTHIRGQGTRRRQEYRSLEPVDPRAAANSDLELNEWLHQGYEQLSGAERILALLRRSGWTWDEIAASLDTTAEAARKRWERAVRRLRQLWRT